jgi:hypothetical protein
MSSSEKTHKNLIITTYLEINEADLAFIYTKMTLSPYKNRKTLDEITSLWMQYSRIVWERTDVV